MRELFTIQTRTVSAGQAVSCSAKETRRLRVLSGRVWVTMEGVAQDYWLFGGDAIRIAPGALTVIEADGVDSSVELTVVRSESALGKAGRRLLRLLRLLRRRNEALPGIRLQQRLQQPKLPANPARKAGKARSSDAENHARPGIVTR